MFDEQIVADMAWKAAREASAALQRVADLMPTVEQKLTVSLLGMATLVATFEDMLERHPGNLVKYREAQSQIRFAKQGQDA